MELLSVRLLTKFSRSIMPVTCLNAVLTSVGGVGRYPAFSVILRTFCGLPRTAGAGRGHPIPNPRPTPEDPAMNDTTSRPQLTRRSRRRGSRLWWC